ncbi:MAG: MBL fold metallo-hydrolase [Acidobacteria bacterium]|nr:MBL fold metallo-hydrolase [Acidobacteriota bacterium]MSO62534.1 MBL fold metallo-hydrolase [Acidobacteriota bacterium]
MTPTLLHAGNPGPFTGEGNWTYLIPGDHPVLIDAGVGQAAHLDAIAASLPAGPAEVIVTHAHSDHTGGAPVIQSRWPSARFSKYPWPERDGRMPWRSLADGDTVMSGAGPLVVLHTPGHSPDHIALWHADSRSLFVGDLLVLGGTVFIPASDGGNLVDYLVSLERLRQLSPARAWPAHGPVIEDPERLITQYLEHRRQREEQVLAALAERIETVDAITDRIYATLAPALVAMARDSVLAHLIKLEADGRAQRHDVHWAIVG